MRTVSWDWSASTTRGGICCRVPTRLDMRSPEENGTAKSNLYYYRARYLAPEHGRFLSDDPAGLAAGPNAFAHVGDNPTTRIDPSGLDWFRPKNEPLVFGRPGSWITPNWWGTWIADNIPAMHTTAKIHDKIVENNTRVWTGLGLPPVAADMLSNYPTMPYAALKAVKKETGNTLRKTVTSFAEFTRVGSKDPSRTETRSSCP